MSRNIAERLLRRNISVAQLAAFALSSFVGLTIVATALLLYSDVRPLVDSDEGLSGSNYMIISRKVSGLNIFGGDDTTFGHDAIADVASQPWVADVAPFEAADFNVSASVALGGRGMSTALFLEAIPDRFLDITPRDWHFDPTTSRTVPIVLSRDYLTLYNFGFATSRGLPQVSEAVMGAVPLRLSVSGNGHQQWLDARIVGFSSRLNTIAVPEEFMTWANSVYGESDTREPSRLIIEVSKPGDPAIDRYLQQHAYEAAGEGSDADRASYLLRVATGAVVGVGVVICILAFVILMLSVGLLLTKSRPMLQKLMLLGYTPWSIARRYYAILGTINALVLLVSLMAAAICRHIWQEPLAQLGCASGGWFLALISIVLLMIFITAVNFASIYRRLKRDFSQKEA